MAKKKNNKIYTIEQLIKAYIILKKKFDEMDKKYGLQCLYGVFGRLYGEEWNKLSWDDKKYIFSQLQKRDCKVSVWLNDFRGIGISEQGSGKPKYDICDVCEDVLSKQDLVKKLDEIHKHIPNFMAACVVFAGIYQKSLTPEIIRLIATEKKTNDDDPARYIERGLLIYECLVVEKMINLKKTPEKLDEVTLSEIDLKKMEQDGEGEVIAEDLDDNLLKELESIAKNRVIFGAPGTGKSDKLKKQQQKFFNFKLLEDNDGTVLEKDAFERVTFHPDYTYAHFVGTYKPVMNGTDIEYRFIPGPFLKVYAMAKKSKSPVLLLIEEINRANVAAVFGDVFQLLDRKDDGESEYPISTSEDVKKWLTDNGVGQADTLSIPKNMYIWATMNSADQGVYPMDTAFKRRWTFEYMDINDGADKVTNWEVTIGGKKYNWDKLRRKINQALLNANVNEDKCLGPFFIKDGANAEEFASKVLMYLFEDVVKQKPSKIFSAELKGFSSIYNKTINKCDLNDIFVKDIYEEFIEKSDNNGANN